MKSILSLAIALAPLVVAQQGPWQQCGGRNWSGRTDCVSGYYCNFLNEWYSQCVPGQATSTAQPTTTQQPTTTTNIPTTTQTGVPAATGLDKAIKAKGKKYFGTCADQNLLNNAQNAAVIKADFGCLTPENSMKWESIQPSRGSFNWGQADFLVNWAQQNNLLVRGHTLVWHSQLPSWVSNVGDGNTLTTIIRDHINAVAGRYAGKLYAWDVINEIFNEDGSLRSSVFSQRLGESFVKLSFDAAKAADPYAKLYINDYNLDSANAKVNGLVNVVRRAMSSGAPIDGIGTQAHLQQGQAGSAAAALSALAGAGVSEVAITELDIVGAPASDYATVTRACLNMPSCVGISVWGVSDKDSWRSSSNPLLFDGNYQKKAAYNSVMQALA